MGYFARVCIGALFLFAGQACARAFELPEAVYPAIPEFAQEYGGFVPAGWIIETREEGDLNGDGVPDLALVLREDNPDNVIVNDPMSPGTDSWDSNPRGLVVAFGVTGGGYALALENRALLPRHESPTLDDPFGGAEIDGGALRVRHHFWANAGSWYTDDVSFTFRYLDGEFALVRYESYTTKRNTGETWETLLDYESGEASLTLGNFSDDGIESETVRRALPEEPLATMEELGDGRLSFDPLDLSWWGIEETDEP